MTRILQSLGPPLAVVGILSALCWPHLNPHHGAEPETLKLAKLLPQRLLPELPPRGQRDPFSQVQVQAEADLPPAVAAAPTASSRLLSLLAPLARSLPGPLSRLAELRPRPATPPRPATIQLDGIARQLELTGTIVSGRQPQAVINQQLYRVGELIPPHQFKEPVELRVAEVTMNQVLLTSPEGDIRLTYGRPAEALRAAAPQATDAPTDTPTDTPTDAPTDTSTAVETPTDPLGRNRHEN